MVMLFCKLSWETAKKSLAGRARLGYLCKGVLFVRSYFCSKGCCLI